MSPEPLDFRALFTADLHLTTRPEDEYRWEIFTWLGTQGKARNVDTIFILGDLTDRKDHHPAKLANALVDRLSDLAKTFQLVILKGNHDYVDPEWPFFRFLSKFPKIKFFSKPGEFTWGYDFLCLPHSNNWRSEWRGLKREEYDFVLIHQAIGGAHTPTGFEVSGVPSSFFDRCDTVIAGDIHVPQQVGKVIYCGSPHPVDFGDDFQPRVLFWNGEALKSVKRTTLKKTVLRITDPKEIRKADLTEGDQVRIVLRLPRSSLSDWTKLRAEALAEASAAGLVARAIEMEPLTERPRLQPGERRQLGNNPASIFEQFCVEQKVAEDMIEVGRELLKVEAK